MGLSFAIMQTEKAHYNKLNEINLVIWLLHTKT
jgi:hypothetical protein